MKSLTFQTDIANVNAVVINSDLKIDLMKIDKEICEIELNCFNEDDEIATLELLENLLTICDAIGSKQIKIISL